VKFLAATILLVFAAATAHAQTSGAGAPEAEGGLPEASFSADFRKYTPPSNDFSPFYSWDATMRLDVTLVRRGRGAIDFGSAFQTVGTENLGPKISVGGTGYLLGLAYTYAIKPHVRIAAGFKHLSTHLTRDLDEKDAEVRARGGVVPKVDDPSEYNVFFFQLVRRFPSAPFKPEINAILMSPNFRLNGEWLGFVRPIYLESRWMLWEHRQTAIVAETQDEVGRNWLQAYSLWLELFRRGPDRGRFQVFVIASPGHGLQVSPIIGGLRNGIALGLRLRFRS
jgi:hypothetical protein